MPGKIEEGCLAVVVRGERPESPTSNIGKVVRVGKFIGEHPAFLGMRDIWEVDKPMRVIDIDAPAFYFYTNTQSECNLERIDENEQEVEECQQSKHVKA